jgi:replicative DNA helicase
MKDMTLDNTMPNDTAAEEALITSILLGIANIEDFTGLKSEDFYSIKNKEIYQAVLTLYGRDDVIDVVTVGSILKDYATKMHMLKTVEYSPAAIKTKTYARRITALSRLRRLITSSQKIITESYSVEAISETEKYISKAQTEILDINLGETTDQIRPIDDIMSESIERIMKYQNNEIPPGYSLGLPTIDPNVQIIGSKLALIAGRPGMGKTSLSLYFALVLAKAGVRVGYLSIEMDSAQITDRLLGYESNTAVSGFYSPGFISDNSMRDIKNSADYLSSLPIYIDDSDAGIEDVERRAKKLVGKYGCQVIFIDQLSKIKGQPGASKFDTYTDNCSTIALLKKELRIPIFLLCQLNRNVEARAIKRPELSDLKQTGMLEEDADMVFLLYRPGYYDESEGQGPTEIILAKNRQGRTCVETNIVFNAKRVFFENGSGYDYGV